MTDVDTFVTEYVKALRSENAAVFAGAGLSIPAGLVDWATLMRDVAAEVGLEIDREADLLSVAQFHVNERGGRNRINQALINEFAERSALTRNHEILTALPIKTYWTTNYDTLIEEALRRAHKRVDIKITQENLAVTLPGRDAVLYKMHGDISRVEAAVITRDDYEAYSATHPLFGMAFQADLVSKTFLFIGFSFSDPNLAYLLGRIRVLLGQSRRDHYCLLRRVQREDFKEEADYTYARARQDLQVRDLRRYGIQGILLNSYGEYTDVLQMVASRFRQSKVFVSGSASTYAPLSDLQGEDFIRRLGAALVAKGWDIVTGFGLGVGPYLLNGALESLQASGSMSLHDRITLRPFPQGIANADERAARWREYRRDMIGRAGVALFIFGNRRDTAGQIGQADGLREEFAIALQSGLVVLPVPWTGYVAKELFDELMEQWDSFYPDSAALRKQYAELGQASDAEEVIERIMRIIEHLQRR